MPSLYLSELFDVSQSEIDTGFAGLQGRGRKKQDPPIERELYLTLEEIYKGCTKKMKISRRVSTDRIAVLALTAICVYSELRVEYAD